MTNKQKIEKLKDIFEDIIWMAIRYADGRHTYAPSLVRDAIEQFQVIFPDWKPKSDKIVKPPKKEDLGGISLKSDYLYDNTDKTLKSNKMKHKMNCNSCGQEFDMRKLSQVLAHEECNGIPVDYKTIEKIPHDKGIEIQNPITWSTAYWWDLPLT